MSISPGSTIPKDPDAELNHEWDWSAWLGDTAQIAASTWEITGPDTALTYDNAAVISGNQKTTLRIKAGTVGKKYRVTNHVTTNETPAQKDDRSVFIQVREM